MSKNKLKHQEILRKIKEANQKTYKYDLPDDPIPDLPLAKEFDQIDQADLDHIYERVAEYRAEYPEGEPLGKRLAPYRMYIDTRDIMLLCRCSLRTAQRLIQNTRFVHEMKKGELVTVTQFCKANDKFNETDVREFLQAMDAAALE